MTKIPKKIIKRLQRNLAFQVHHNISANLLHQKGVLNQIDHSSFKSLGGSIHNQAVYPTSIPETVPLPGPFQETESNPVITAKDIDDFGEANFVADPFLWLDQKGTWHMFFEVYNDNRSSGAAIGHATSANLVNWTYDRIVLDTNNHTSFPFVFKYDGTIFMIPEEEPTSKQPSVTLYEATSFPRKWTRRKALLTPPNANDDSIIFPWNDHWWLFVGDTHKINGIYAYYSENPLSENWKPHQDNPIVEDRRSAVRPGGRPIIQGESIVLFYQDCQRYYGHKLRAYKTTELSPESYNDVELDFSPILSPKTGVFGWNAGRMHHIDSWWTGNEWVCAVDGDLHNHRLNPTFWSISIYVSN